MAHQGTSPFRDEILQLQQNGITRVALPRLDDPSVIPLWFGEGDAVTPEFVREIAQKALADGDTFYSNPRGRPLLREAIQTYLNGLYGLDIDLDRISVPGAAMLGVTLAAQCALSDGDHGLIVGPAWPNIVDTFHITGAELSWVRQRETPAGWELTADEIIAAMRPNTRAVFINSPCNPTGWIMPSAEQAHLLAACRDRGVLVIADEVYHRTVFEGKAAPSFLEVAAPDDPLIVINGFSKAWAMTGWRLGWVVHPAGQGDPWAVLSECFNTGTTVFLQDAAAAALRDGEPFVNSLRGQYAAGRDMMMKYLGQHPAAEVHRPEGAFYGFVKVRGISDSLELCQRLLADFDVGTAPGYTFGPENDAFFRLCFAASPERLEDGLQRIVQFLDRL